VCSQAWHRLTSGGNIIETGTDCYRLAHTRARAEQHIAGCVNNSGTRTSIQPPSTAIRRVAVQHRLKPAPQTLQLERVSRSELNLDPTGVGHRSGDRQCRLSHVNAQNRQSQRGDVRGDVKSVLAGPTARIEHRSGDSAFGSQTHYRWLRLAKIPRRRAVVVGRIPGQSRQPFVTGWVPTPERIVSEGS